MTCHSFKSAQITFKGSSLISIWTIQFIKYSVINSFCCLNDIFKHGGNFLLFYALLYISLFLINWRFLLRQLLKNIIHFLVVIIKHYLLINWDCLDHISHKFCLFRMDNMPSSLNSCLTCHFINLLLIDSSLMNLSCYILERFLLLGIFKDRRLIFSKLNDLFVLGGEMSRRILGALRLWLWRVRSFH